MKNAIVLLILATSVVGSSAQAQTAMVAPTELPKWMHGKLTTEKGKCKDGRDDELLIRISPKIVSRYENYCKVTKINLVDTYGGDDLDVKLTCQAEDATIKSSILLVNQEDTQIKYVEPEWKNQHAWMFRCKR
jgi:hypothetical protein